MDYFSELYKSSLYSKKNPNYHEEDSPFKWKNFEILIKKSIQKKDFRAKDIYSVCEIGCGTGTILNYLNNSNLFNNLNKIEGWDINPIAIEIAKENFPEIDFFDKDLFETDRLFDLAVCADVFEHIENPYQFLRKLNSKSKYFLFCIPLEMNLLSMIQGKDIFKKSFDSVGHLHFYSAPSAKLILEITNYEIIYSRFAKNRTRNYFANPSLKKLLALIPQFFIQLFSPYLSSLLMGDHLIVLAKRKDLN